MVVFQERYASNRLCMGRPMHIKRTENAKVATTRFILDSFAVSYTQLQHLAGELIEERREVLDVSAVLELLHNGPDVSFVFLTSLSVEVGTRSLRFATPHITTSVTIISHYRKTNEKMGNVTILGKSVLLSLKIVLSTHESCCTMRLIL